MKLRRPGADYQVRQDRVWRSRDDAYWWRSKPAYGESPGCRSRENGPRPVMDGGLTLVVVLGTRSASLSR